MHEVVIFSGLQALRDYLQIHKKFIESNETSAIERWACSFSARYDLDTDLVNLRYVQDDHFHSPLNSSGENEESPLALRVEGRNLLKVKPGLYSALAYPRSSRERFRGVELCWRDVTSFGTLLEMCGIHEAADSGEKDFVMVLQNVSVPKSRQRSLDIEQ